MSLMPITMQLLEWRGAKGSRSANNGNVICYGGVLMFTSGLMEWVLGNTFPFLVFCTYGTKYYILEAHTKISALTHTTSMQGHSTPPTDSL